MKKSEKDSFSLLSVLNSGPSSFGFSKFNENSLPPPVPCVEVLFSEVPSSAKTDMEPICVIEGLSLLKGRVSTLDVFGVADSDLVPGKYEGGLKLWEGSIDLIKILHSETQEERLSLTEKRVLELGCGHGLPGIFACLKGACSVHFQDFNVEVLRHLTIPNVKANINKCQNMDQIDLRFFAGDWSEIQHLFSSKHDKKSPITYTDVDISNGYDVILMAETVYSIASLQTLYELMKKCTRYPCGVVYLSAKKHYFGVGGGTRQFQAIVEQEDVMTGCKIAEITDGSSNVREVWKFFFK